MCFSYVKQQAAVFMFEFTAAALCVCAAKRNKHVAEFLQANITQSAICSDSQFILKD